MGFRSAMQHGIQERNTTMIIFPGFRRLQPLNSSVGKVSCFRALWRPCLRAQDLAQKLGRPSTPRLVIV